MSKKICAIMVMLGWSSGLFALEKERDFSSLAPQSTATCSIAGENNSLPRSSSSAAGDVKPRKKSFRQRLFLNTCRAARFTKTVGVGALKVAGYATLICIATIANTPAPTWQRAEPSSSDTSAPLAQATRTSRRLANTYAPASSRLTSTSPRLTSAQGEFLGTLSSDKYAADSISNPYGEYGSKYSPKSINNPYSQYGSKYSPDGATNPYTTGGAKIVSPQGEFLGTLNGNKYDPNSIANPYGMGSPYAANGVNNPYSPNYLGKL